jgi:putative transposase
MTPACSWRARGRGTRTISTVTDAVMDDAVARQTRPLDDVYPVVFSDCLVLKAREG